MAFFSSSLMTSFLFLISICQFTVASTQFQDSFFFIGRHDSSMINLSLSFTRPLKHGPDSNAFFDGWLYWKNNWIHLPPDFLPNDTPSPQVIPSSPVFDFSWPGLQSPGTFIYQSDPIHFKILFNKPLGLHSLSSSRQRQEFYISNSTFIGKKHQIPGIILYWRRRAEMETDSVPPANNFPETGMVSILNSRFGETFLFWKSNPFNKHDTVPFILKLKYDGTVVTDRKDLDGLAIGMDTLYSPPLDTGWEVSSPLLDLVFDLQSQGVSPRLKHRRIHAVSGKVFHDQQYQRVSGILWDFKTDPEIRKIIFPPEEEKKSPFTSFRKKKSLIRPRK